MLAFFYKIQEISQKVFVYDRILEITLLKNVLGVLKRPMVYESIKKVAMMLVKTILKHNN